MFEFFGTSFFFFKQVFKSYGWLLRGATFDFSELLITTFLLLAFQIALQFPYRFWDSKVQGADFFGHVPPSAQQAGFLPCSMAYGSPGKVMGVRTWFEFPLVNSLNLV